MVDGVFMVDGPSINHGQKAINHKSWLMARLREWLMVGLNVGLDMVHVSDQSNPYRPDSELVMVGGDFMVDGPSINHPQKAINHKSWLIGLLGKIDEI